MRKIQPRLRLERSGKAPFKIAAIVVLSATILGCHGTGSQAIHQSADCCSAACGACTQPEGDCGCSSDCSGSHAAEESAPADEVKQRGYDEAQNQTGPSTETSSSSTDGPETDQVLTSEQAFLHRDITVSKLGRRPSAFDSPRIRKKSESAIKTAHSDQPGEEPLLARSARESILSVPGRFGESITGLFHKARHAISSRLDREKQTKQPRTFAPFRTSTVVRRQKTKVTQSAFSSQASADSHLPTTKQISHSTVGDGTVEPQSPFTAP